MHLDAVACQVHGPGTPGAVHQDDQPPADERVHALGDHCLVDADELGDLGRGESGVKRQDRNHPPVVGAEAETASQLVRFSPHQSIGQQREQARREVIGVDGVLKWFPLDALIEPVHVVLRASGSESGRVGSDSSRRSGSGEESARPRSCEVLLSAPSPRGLRGRWWRWSGCPGTHGCLRHPARDRCRTASCRRTEHAGRGGWRRGR